MLVAMLVAHFLLVAACLLHRTVYREGRDVNRRSHQGHAQILAQDVVAEGSDVSWGNRRDIRCDRAGAIC